MDLQFPNTHEVSFSLKSPLENFTKCSNTSEPNYELGLYCYPECTEETTTKR